MVTVVERRDWATHPDLATGQWEGGEANLSIIFHTSESPGNGPGLHTHPYPETFIIQEGRALFTVGDQQMEASAGQILMVPPNTPHGFKSLGPGTYRSINIHASGTFETHWL
jgi:mannose-6-phosphate isomerase-like protein (cupin superfamily)